MLLQPAVVQESSKGPSLGSPFRRLQDDWLYTFAKFSSWKYPILLAPGVSKTFGNHFKNPSNNGTVPLGLQCSWECSKAVRGDWLSFHHLDQEADVPITAIVVPTESCKSAWYGHHPLGRVKGPFSILVQSKLVRSSWGHRADPRRRMQKHILEKKECVGHS